MIKPTLAAWAALAKIAGGEAQAKKMFSDWQSSVATTTSNIAYTHSN